MSATRPVHRRQDTDAGVTDGASDKAASVRQAPSASSSDDTLAAALLVSAQDKTAALPKWTTSRKELWSYYIYYIGCSGLGPFNYSPGQLQNLITLAAAAAGGDTCGGEGQDVCRLAWAGAERTPQSITLLANGISFAVQAALFLVIGSLADYGTWRPWILIVSTLISVGISFAWLGVTDPASWRIGVALYIIGLIFYQTSLTYWTAAFPGLARDLPEMRESAAALAETPPRTTAEEHHKLDTMSRNRIANIAFAVCSLGELVVLAIIQGMLISLKSDSSTEANTRALSIATAFTGGAWLLVALPWFILEKRRPGRNLPVGQSYWTVGFVTIAQTCRHVWKLKQTLLYLVFYFIMGDALNTSVTVISTVQNSLISFSGQTFNLLLIVGIAAQGVGIYAFWRVQHHWKLGTVTMLKVVCGFIVLLQVWGLIGIFTLRFGFHNVWEAYAYQAFYGLFVCPWYAYSQTGISEVSPRGLEFQVFSLLNLVGRTSSFVGPFVSSALADYGNQSLPFYFLLGMAILGSLFLIPMDAAKARKEQARFIAQQVPEAQRTSGAAYTTTHELV